MNIRPEAKDNRKMLNSIEEESSTIGKIGLTQGTGGIKAKENKNKRPQQEGQKLKKQRWRNERTRKKIY